MCTLSDCLQTNPKVFNNFIKFSKVWSDPNCSVFTHFWNSGWLWTFLRGNPRIQYVSIATSFRGSTLLNSHPPTSAESGVGQFLVMLRQVLADGWSNEITRVLPPKKMKVGINVVCLVPHMSPKDSGAWFHAPVAANRSTTFGFYASMIGFDDLIASSRPGY